MRDFYSITKIDLEKDEEVLFSSRKLKRNNLLMMFESALFALIACLLFAIIMGLAINDFFGVLIVSGICFLPTFLFFFLAKLIVMYSSKFYFTDRRIIFKGKNAIRISEWFSCKYDEILFDTFGSFSRVYKIVVNTHVKRVSVKLLYLHKTSPVPSFLSKKIRCIRSTKIARAVQISDILLNLLVCLVLVAGICMVVAGLSGLSAEIYYGGTYGFLEYFFKSGSSMTLYYEKIIFYAIFVIITLILFLVLNHILNKKHNEMF